MWRTVAASGALAVGLFFPRPQYYVGRAHTAPKWEPTGSDDEMTEGRRKLSIVARAYTRKEGIKLLEEAAQANPAHDHHLLLMADWRPWWSRAPAHTRPNTIASALATKI